MNIIHLLKKHDGEGITWVFNGANILRWNLEVKPFIDQ